MTPSSSCYCTSIVIVMTLNPKFLSLKCLNFANNRRQQETVCSNIIQSASLKRCQICRHIFFGYFIFATSCTSVIHLITAWSCCGFGRKATNNNGKKHKLNWPVALVFLLEDGLNLACCASRCFSWKQEEKNTTWNEINTHMLSATWFVKPYLHKCVRLCTTISSWHLCLSKKC